MPKTYYEIKIDSLEEMQIPNCCIVCGESKCEEISVQFSKEMGLLNSLLSLGAIGVETVNLNIKLCRQHSDQYLAELRKYRRTLLFTFLPCMIILFGGGILITLFENIESPRILKDLFGALGMLGAVSGISSYFIFRNRSKFFSIRLRWKSKQYTLLLPLEDGAKALAVANNTTIHKINA